MKVKALIIDNIKNSLIYWPYLIALIDKFIGFSDWMPQPIKSAVSTINS